MKHPSTLSIAALLCTAGFSMADPVYTTPVGYYEFDAPAGSTLFVPGFVNSAVFAGALQDSQPTTLTLAGDPFSAGQFDAVGDFATHYVEITEGPNEGVIVDIDSNTSSIITLSSDISALSLNGDESIAIRPHSTLGGVFSSAEDSLSAFSDSATFYEADGSPTTYYFIGAGEWSTDFFTDDGGARPIAPGTGFILNVASQADLTLVGEVKYSPTVIQVNGNGVFNIVGPVNPLSGDSARIVDLGFADIVPFSDSITLYSPGSFITPVGTYYSDGDGNVTSDFFTPSEDTFTFTLGGLFSTATDSALKIDSGLE